MLFVAYFREKITKKKEASQICEAFFELTPMKIQNKNLYSVIDQIEYPLAGASMVTAPVSSEVGKYVEFEL